MDVATILSGVCALVLALVSFIGKGALERITVLESRAADSEKALAVMLASKIHERVERLELAMAEIKSDVRLIVKMLEEQSGRRH